MNHVAALNSLLAIDSIVYGSTHQPLSAEKLDQLKEALNHLQASMADDAYAFKKVTGLCALIRAGFFGKDSQPSRNQQEILEEVKALASYLRD